MQCQRHITVRATKRMAAVTAVHIRRETATVEKQNGLLVGRKDAFDLAGQAQGEQPLAYPLGVHQRDGKDLGQWPSVHSVGHQQELVATELCVLVGLQGWRGRAEHDDRILPLSAHHGEVAGVVAR